MSNIVIDNPKRHFLTRNDVFRRTLRKNPFRGVGCSIIEEPPKNEEKTSHPKSTAKSRIWRKETPEPIDTKFCMSSAVHDVITHVNFWEDRLRCFGVLITVFFSKNAVMLSLIIDSLFYMGQKWERLAYNYLDQLCHFSWRLVQY